MATPSPSRARFVALDGVRAIAAYGVVATHVGFASGRSLDNGPFAPMLSRLDFGVTLFFLLSGFVIYRPFVVSSFTSIAATPRRRFYIRRAARILPAYWLVVVATLAFLSVRNTGRADWLSYLTLLQTYVGHNVDPSLTQMWTLSVEISFYLLVPFMAGWACRGVKGGDRHPLIRRQLVLIGGLCLISVGANLLGNLASDPGVDSLTWLPANLDWFAAGMLLAVVSATPRDLLVPGFQTMREIARAGGTCWILGALLFWFATLPIAGPRLLLVLTGWEWSFRHYLYAAAALMFLLPLTLADPGRLAQVLTRRPLRELGIVSYGIYLWHLPLLIALQRWLGYRTFGGHFLILFVATCVLATAAATISWHLIEKPTMRWASNFYSTRSGRSVSATTASTSDNSASTSSP